MRGKTPFEFSYLMPVSSQLSRFRGKQRILFRAVPKLEIRGQDLIRALKVREMADSWKLNNVFLIGHEFTKSPNQMLP